jgi:hypothetical protein
LKAVILLCGLAYCQGLPAQAQSDDYKVQITPYLFASSVDGTIVEQGRTANVNASFSDIVDHLDMAAMVYFDARFAGRWRALIDNMYIKVSNERSTPLPVFSSVTVASKLWIADPEGGYAVIQGEGKELDVVAGVRIWTMKNDLTLFSQNLAVDRGHGSRSVFDPVVGLRFTSDLPHKAFLFAKGDVGGFDAGATLDWQAFGGVGFKVHDKIALSVGYRYLSIQNEPRDSSYDIVLKGVIVGLGFRF